jgi:hypothetical protein
MTVGACGLVRLPGAIGTCFDEMNGALIFLRNGKERAQRKGGGDFQHRTTIEFMHRGVLSPNVAMLVDHRWSEKGQIGEKVRREKALDFSGCNSRPGTGSLHPVAIEAAAEATKLSELSMERVAWRLRERAGHNASER